MTPESFRAYAGSMGDPMFLLSTDGVVLAANGPAAAFAGRVPGALVGRPILELVTESEGEIQRALESWAASGFETGHPLSFRGANGTPRRCRGQGMRVERPGPEGMALVLLRCVPGGNHVESIAALHRQLDALQAEVAAQAAQIERMPANGGPSEAPSAHSPDPSDGARVGLPERIEALSNLAGGIAHEFNNLLTVIGAEVELAMEGADVDAETKSTLARVRDAADRAGYLVASLLAFSRRQVVHLSRFDLRDLVRDALPKVDSALGDRVSLVVTQSPESLPVAADRTQMQQVILNLALNARDASQREGHLWVRTRRTVLSRDFAAAHPGSSEGEFAVLEVRDDGVGMPKEIVPRIFEPFFTTKNPGRGRGSDSPRRTAS